MEIALDCDGILADFVTESLSILEMLSGEKIPSEHIVTWDVFDSVPRALRQYKTAVYDALRDKGGAAGFPAYPGAFDMVRELRRFGAVFVVTSPFDPSDYWMPERTKWLERHFGFHHNDVIHCAKKSRTRADVFVDDKPSNVREFAAANPAALSLLWDAPYNRGAKDLTRVVNAKELIYLVQRRKRLWHPDERSPDQQPAGEIDSEAIPPTWAKS